MSRFDDWKLKEDMRMQDERMRMDMMRDKYPPINDPIRPMNNPIDFGPLDRTMDMQENFRKPMADLSDPMRDIRPDPMGPMNISRGVDMQPLNDMLMFQKKGVF